MQPVLNRLKHHKKKIIIALLLWIAFYFSLPNPLFKEPTSAVVTASHNELLGAVIAQDGQWRFPEVDSVPAKFEACILEFEDAYFYYHWGFNPVSIVKAFANNLKVGKVVRGGSTLTQQVIRLFRKNKGRSYFEKLIELVLATRLECGYSKEDILKLYASNAPFGGNVVGLEMASWRYFGLKPKQLSWAESATLAVLPNAPALIYPGKNHLLLKEKRDRLLKKLYQKQVIDSLTYELALAEELPQKPYPLPTVAPHFVQEIVKTNKGQRVQTSIDMYLQKQVNRLAKQQYERLKQNEVYNLAVLVLDVKTRKVLAYVGNSPTDKAHQKDVNNVTALRSTGSVIKPILYAQMLQSGDLLPTQLVADVPTQIVGYAPKNFNLTFDGAVPANQALTRSLNVPFVRMLRHYGLQKFRDDLKDYHFSGITKSADHYGLSLILGGAEVSLWDLCKVYAGFSGIVNHYEPLGYQYYQNEFVEPLYRQADRVVLGNVQENETVLDVGTVFTTLNELTEVNRPENEQAWKYYSSSRKIAWKTGTSFGNKDAWAVGITPQYVVGVWVGNSDGEGRPGLTGTSGAAPLLFDIFDVLPKSDWFAMPYNDLIEVDICEKSGCLALPICQSVKKWIPKNGIKGKSCPYHKLIQVDKTEQFRVNTNCEYIGNCITKTWFVLPPLMAYYYQQNHSDYRLMPNFRSDCNALERNKMDFVFPTQFRTKISLTKNISGILNPIVLKLTHSNFSAQVYWYMDKQFIKSTETYHELAIQPSEGTHVIIAIDDFGNEIRRILVVD